MSRPHAALTRLVAGWGLSVVAETAGLVALLVLAYETGGAGLVAAFGVVRMLPVLLVGPVVIARSDSGHREWWVLATLVLRALLTGTAAALAVLGLPWPALAAGAAASVLFTTHRPLNAAVMPAVARTPAELTSANAASAFAENAGALCGPVLAGVTLVVAGPSAVLTAGSVLSLVSALFVAGVRTSGTPVAASRRSSLRTVAGDLGTGFRVLRDPPFLLPLTCLQTAARGVLLVAVVVLAVDEFDIGDPGVGWLTAMMGVGGILGALLAAWKVGSRRLSRAFVVGVALWGLPMAVLGLATETAVGFVAFAVIGLGNAVLDVGLFTLVARTAPRQLTGRVFAALEVAIVASVTVGSLVAGVLVPAVGVRSVLVGVGCLLVLVAGVSWLRATDVDRTLVPLANVEPLRACPALNGLPLVVIEHLASAADARAYRPGETVISQGEEGHEFFVVVDGRAEVDVDGTVVGHLQSGEGFGEVALLRRVPRTASVTATTQLTTLVVAQGDFMAFVAGNPASAASLRATTQDRELANRRTRGGLHRG